MGSRSGVIRRERAGNRISGQAEDDAELDAVLWRLCLQTNDLNAAGFRKTVFKMHLKAIQGKRKYRQCEFSSVTRS